MKLFIDTANVEEIREAASYGILAGVTTNPSLIAKEGRKLEDVIQEIASLVNGPISAEVSEGDAESMIAQGRELAKIHPNIVIKLPMTWAGIKACKTLVSEGIKTNVTLCFSVDQALLAMEAGATYVSPFMGRLDDADMEAEALIRKSPTSKRFMVMRRRSSPLPSVTSSMLRWPLLPEAISRQFHTRSS